MAIQVQLPSVSASHAAESTWARQGSSVDGVPPQPHSQGGHVSPGAQAGQSHWHVSPPVQLSSGAHEQSHGGQLSPGPHSGHTQVQVPPPVEPPPPEPPPLGQSHSQGAQSAPGSQ